MTIITWCIQTLCNFRVFWFISSLQLEIHKTDEFRLEFTQFTYISKHSKRREKLERNSFVTYANEEDKEYTKAIDLQM